MSLINDALKKAQSQRAEALPATTVSTPVEYRTTANRPAPARNYLLIGGGALALVVLSVSITVLLLRPDSPPVAIAPPSAPVESLSPAIVAVAPPKLTIPSMSVGSPTSSAPTPSPAPAPVEETPSETAPVARPEPAPVAPVAFAAVLPASTPASAPPPPASAVAGDDPIPARLPSMMPPPPGSVPRIQGFIDRLRVTGIRLSSTGDRVLLNDRLFRVDEMIDHGLGLQLLKIEPGILTFVEVSTGKTYIKLF